MRGGVRQLTSCVQCRESCSRQFSKVIGGLSTFRQREADREDFEQVDTFRVLWKWTVLR